MVSQRSWSESPGEMRNVLGSGGGDGSGGPPSRLRDLEEDVELAVEVEKSEERVPAGDGGAGLRGKNHSDSSSWFALLMILNT